MPDLHAGHVKDAWARWCGYAREHDWAARPVLRVPIPSVHGSVLDFGINASVAKTAFFRNVVYRRETGFLDGLRAWRIVGEIPGTDIKDVEVACGTFE